MLVPQARGELSAALFRDLRRGDPHARLPRLRSGGREDTQIALWALYELSYRGFEDVDPRLEWCPTLIALRNRLQDRFERELLDRAGERLRELDARASLQERLEQLTASSGPSLAEYLHREATLEQFREFLVLRSIYHLKEADPHAWLLPRLAGAAKVALAEILYDEYGDGHRDRNHQRLFEAALEAAGLDTTYGAYIEQAPAEVLEVSNAMSLLCFNRRLMAAGAGHLAAFEMTSSLPSRRIVQGIERLQLPDGVRRYFDEHVEADAVHEQVAARDLCGSLVESDPTCLEDVLLGAAISVQTESASATAILDAWRAGGSALRAAQTELYETATA